jgi:hypothetical protein
MTILYLTIILWASLNLLMIKSKAQNFIRISNSFDCRDLSPINIAAKLLNFIEILVSVWFWRVAINSENFSLSTYDQRIIVWWSSKNQLTIKKLWLSYDYLTIILWLSFNLHMIKYYTQIFIRTFSSFDHRALSSINLATKLLNFIDTLVSIWFWRVSINSKNFSRSNYDHRIIVWWSPNNHFKLESYSNLSITIQLYYYCLSITIWSNPAHKFSFGSPPLLTAEP